MDAGTVFFYPLYTMLPDPQSLPQVQEQNDARTGRLTNNIIISRRKISCTLRRILGRSWAKQTKSA